MKSILTTFALLLALSVAAKQPPVTEEEYLRADSTLWLEYEAFGARLYEQAQANPELADSLEMAAETELERVLERNAQLALQYAATPSGLKRCFMVRLDVSKSDLRRALKEVPRDLRQSTYGRAIQQHIRTRQVEEGARAPRIAAVNEVDERFDLRALEGRRVLLLYGGLGCMGPQGRAYLADLYAKTSREDLEVVVYWAVETVEQLKELKAHYGVDYQFITECMADCSPFKIEYGVQATPTCFLVDRDGRVLVKSEGLAPERFDAILLSGEE